MPFRPSIVIHRVTELSPEWMLSREIKGLLIDVDNTVAPYHLEEIPPDIHEWLMRIKSVGIKFVPYSNAKPYRIENFCRKYEIKNPGMAIKPLNLGLNRALKILGEPKRNVVMVGDQVFTDNLAGIFSGIRVVLVDPVSTREFPATKLMRLVERLAGRSRWKYDKINMNSGRP